MSRRQELTKRGQDVEGVVVRTWRTSHRINGNWFTRAYAQVVYQTPWGERDVTVKGLFRSGDKVRLLFDEKGAIQAPH